MNTYWGYLLLGSLALFYGLLLVVPGEDSVYRGVIVPFWVGWVFAPAGVLICIISIRAMLRGEGKPKPPKKYTDEELAQFKANLDAMYLREHGELPDKIPADTKDPKNL